MQRGKLDMNVFIYMYPEQYLEDTCMIVSCLYKLVKIVLLNEDYFVMQRSDRLSSVMIMTNLISMCKD